MPSCSAKLRRPSVGNDKEQALQDKADAIVSAIDDMIKARMGAFHGETEREYLKYLLVELFR